MKAGGKIILVGEVAVKDVEGKPWAEASKLSKVSVPSAASDWLKELAPRLNGLRGVDGKLDGLWTCRRGKQTFIFNSNDRPVELDTGGGKKTLAPAAIWISE